MTNIEIHQAVSACSRIATCDQCPLNNLDYRCTDVLLDELEKALLEPCQGNGTSSPTTRQSILNEAERCVCGQRKQDYGELEDNFGKIAVMWSAYTGNSITPSDVAAMMGLLKIARIAGNAQHMDNWVDLAGYAACGGEIAGKGAQE